MSEDMQKQLAEYLKDFVGAIKAGGEFAMQQAPMVVQEKIAFGRAQESIELAACVLVLVGLTVMLVQLYKEADDCLVIPVGVLTLLAVGVTAINVPDVLQVWLAPRLYILEWAASLLR